MIQKLVRPLLEVMLVFCMMLSVSGIVADESWISLLYSAPSVHGDQHAYVYEQFCSGHEQQFSWFKLQTFSKKTFSFSEIHHIRPKNTFKQFSGLYRCIFAVLSQVFSQPRNLDAPLSLLCGSCIFLDVGLIFQASFFLETFANKPHFCSLNLIVTSFQCSHLLMLASCCYWRSKSVFNIHTLFLHIV